MKKALSCLVVILMAASILQVGLTTTPVKAAENKNGTFLAVRFAPVGFDRDGKELDGNRDFPWQRTGERVWGRVGYPMPDSLTAVGSPFPGVDANGRGFYPQINIPAKSFDANNPNDIPTDTVPLFWTDFYLDVNPAGGRSQQTERWYAVYDSAGQLWFDADGRFNDARYYEPADPHNMNGIYISESCKNNPLARVDPNTGNNTQGPYILNPKNPRFSALGHMLDEDGNTRIYFWDKNRTQRIFRLGWSDMPDFYAGTDVQGSLITTTRAYNGTDWDATRAYPLIDFVYWGTGSQYDMDANGDPQVVSPINNPTTNNTNTPPKNSYTWYYRNPTAPADPPPDYLMDMRVLPGDELHTDNVSNMMQNKAKTFYNQIEDQNYFAAVSMYHPGEYIYRKGGASHYNGGFQNSLYLVQAGDIRLTPVSVYNNGEVRNYPINTVVKLTDWDCAHSWGVSYNPAPYDPLNPSNGGRVNLTVHPKFHELFRFVVNFDQTTTPPEFFGRRLRAMDDEVHVENIQTPSDLGLFSADNKVRGWHSYQPGEWIYREGNHPNSSQMTDLLNGVVSIGDYRLSNVNAWVDPNTLKIDQTLGTLNSDVSVYLGGQVEGQTVTRVHGDLLILAEVLWGGCNQPAYNLSVESDVWQGMVPSVTAAALHSPNGDVKVSAQTIQKNTVLDPDGSRFNIPATTFQNVNLKYREFIGVQLWKDDGIDNHLGQNYPNDPNSGKQADKLVAYNLSDDYKAGRVGEEFIGSNNMIYTEKDHGRELHSFPADVMFYDTETQNQTQIRDFATYGCGEAVYRDVDGNALVSSGDMRLTQVTVTINNNVITYKADTRVSPGDADVAMVLRPFPHHMYAFFDKAWPEKDIPLNWTYDVGEEIYQLTQDWYNTNFTISTTNTYWMMSSLFLDTDQDGLVSIGDIIIFDYNNITPPGYVVGPTYYDLGTAYTTPTNLVMDPVRNVVYVKGISATDSTIVEPHDFRLNRSYNYLPYTRVEASHTDNGHSVMVANLAAIQDTTKRDQILVYHPVFGPIELAVRITPYTVRLENTRLTDVNISDVSYICGSVVGEKLDLWTNENPVYGLSMGKNSNFRYIDWEVFPSASLGLNVKIDRTLKVEQTSQIDVSVDPAPKPGYWEDGKFIPGEKVYVMIRNVEGPNGVKLYETMKVVTAENPVATFQFTPYRGSCPPSGQSAGWKRTISSSRYVLKDYDLRVRIVAVKDEGGVKDPAPQTYYIDSKGETKAMPIIDPFWRMHDNTNFRAGQANGNVAWNPPAYNVPTFPEELMNTFDCFDQKRYEVAPEDLEFISSKKCMQVLDQRFPNLQLTLVDADNPHDVNDPAGMRLSVPTGEEVAVMYDATGAGIDYMFTGWLKGRVTGHVYGDTSKAPISVEGTEENPIRVIVQVHTDGTYLFWHWEDIGPHPGMLDSGDNLYTPYTLSPTGRTPGYIYVRERPNFNDNDCSIGTSNCNFGGTGFKQLNYITRNDKFGAFEVLTLGVPTYMMNHGERSATDDGGEIQVAVLPRDAASKLKVRVYTYNLTFDYNSTIQHPPYFIVDERPADPGMFNDDLHRLNSFYTMGVDYVGVKEYKVLPPDPYVNFAELSIVDHALQNSRVNYTAGANPTSRLNVPTPQIQAPYNPLILDVGRDFRGYPGGQTHTGRVQGSVTASGVTRSTQDHSGWNAYPAIWWWFWYNNVNLNNFTDFNKLGTEFFPLTDYGFYFIVKDMDGRHLTFDQTAPIDYRIRRMVISGEFAQPKVFDTVRNKVQAEYEYNGLRHVPIAYDWTGEIIIDAANANEYEHAWGTNWVNVDRDGGLYDVTNEYLADSRRLDYRGLQNVFRFEEIIPIGHGIVNIQVTLWDGTLKIFQDCCAEPPTDGVDIHALTVEADVNVVTADQDNKVAVTVTEYEPMQAVQAANDAFVYVWQDRGVLNPRTKLYDGAGDGWVTNPPTSSDFSGLAPQFFREDDLNNDGKISFADYETEIIGTYDMATNTWAGGVIDARTFQRNNGQYIFDLSATNGAMVTTTGLDFGGRKGDPDHVISEFETLPVMVTAYKYGDDNNDRSFRPLYNFGNNVPQYSHEVYLAGQKFIEVAPKMDLSVSVQPNPLTAGITPELVDPVSPLTFVVTDDEGNPVDLSRGVPDASGSNLVENEDIWNHLFKDPHPDPLPEYYWLRTDLHNDDGTRINNRRLYSTASKPFQPIAIDFTLAKDGKYAFRGFCANDEGNFDVFIYTPDRKHAAKATVNVVLPTVEYSIVNTEDQAGTAFDTPGAPDFLLTAADNRLYRITVSVKNAQGLLLKGITRGVSTCGGGIKNTARFTPFSTRPASFDFTERDRYLFAEHFLQDLYPYMLHIGYDFNDNGKVDVRNSELYTLGAFRHTANRAGQVSQGQVFYNTSLFRYDEQSINAGWDITPNPQLPPPLSGWGLGAIYNSAHRGGYLFSDIDGDGRLTFNDALGLDVNGQTTFYIFAEDLAYIGGLSGQNVYCNNPAEGDLVGYPPSFKTDPFSVIKRFDPNRTPDGTFFLDWEALPNKEVQIAAPNLRALEAKTRVELSKDLLNANNYDLVYATENHMVVEVRPADPRDLPMKEDGRVFLFGNQHQTAIYGHTKASASDPKVMETTLHFTPTGLNEGIAYLGYFRPNSNYLVEPYNFKNTSTYTIRDLVHFDSIRGLQVEIHSDGPLYVNKLNTITAKVTEIGTNAPVQGANVNIEGPGIKASKTTDKDGIATFDVTPNDKGVVKVVASKEGRIIGMAEIRVLTDTTAPWIELDPVHPITNRPQQEVTGRTNPGNTVTLNGGPAQVAQDGSFKGTVTLKEGLNTIVGEAKNAQGMTVRKMLTVLLKTTPPNLFIDDPGYLVDVTEVEITGRVDVMYNGDHEYPAKVTVNGQPAQVTHDIWKAMVKVNPGRNTINVEATDAVGNRNTASREILVYKRTIIQLTIDNIIPTINGEPASPLGAPPFISGGRTMVPLRFIAEAFGAKVEYEAATKSISIVLGDMNITMQIGNTTVMVNGKSYTIDAPPVIVNGMTFVPVRFVAEILGARVDYDAATRTVTITRDLLP